LPAVVNAAPALTCTAETTLDEYVNVHCSAAGSEPGVTVRLSVSVTGAPAVPFADDNCRESCPNEAKVKLLKRRTAAMRGSISFQRSTNRWRPALRQNGYSLGMANRIP